MNAIHLTHAALAEVPIAVSAHSLNEHERPVTACPLRPIRPRLLAHAPLAHFFTSPLASPYTSAKCSSQWSSFVAGRLQ